MAKNSAVMDTALGVTVALAMISGVGWGIYEWCVDDPGEIYSDCMEIVYEKREWCIERKGNDKGTMERCSDAYIGGTELCGK